MRTPPPACYPAPCPKTSFRGFISRNCRGQAPCLSWLPASWGLAPHSSPCQPVTLWLDVAGAALGSRGHCWGGHSPASPAQSGCHSFLGNTQPETSFALQSPRGSPAPGLVQPMPTVPLQTPPGRVLGCQRRRRHHPLQREGQAPSCVMPLGPWAQHPGSHTGGPEAWRG